MKIRRIATGVVTLGVQSKDLQTLTAMFSEDKVSEIFCLADEFCNFIANALSAIAAYCFFEKKPAIDVEFINDGQFSLF